jgi:WD40 repeat protein
MEEELIRPLRVFVSHTSELARFPEKRSFVDAACAAVRRAGGVAVAMADFGARDQRSLEVCRAEVLGCDVYLGVIGFRYGTPVPGSDDGVSYTEFEFDVAGHAGMPRLVFLLNEVTATIPVALVDVDRSRINRFRRRLQDERVTVVVANPDDLAARVGEGLAILARDRRSSQAELRRPWMAPPVDRMVERSELGSRLIAALTASGALEVGLTTGLAGAGGFGKTTLAAWVCHRPEIRRRYPGGLLWVTVGQEIHGADLAEKINDLTFTLCGRRPAISDPDAAGAELGRVLDEREPVLLVVDDVWNDQQLRPFRFGGRATTRLVTTRIPGLLPAGEPRIPVDAMSADQACALVTDGVAGLPAAAAEQLAAIAGRWPVLLNLVNGLLRRRTDRGQPPGEAASEIVRRLTVEGPTALDPARPADRTRAVATTVEASLTLLQPTNQDHYLDLAIFPEDVDIPLDVLRLLWPTGLVDTLCEELTELGLVADYRLDLPGPRLVLHDVMRAYLSTRRDTAGRADVHRRLVTAAVNLLPTDGLAGRTPWWLLPADAGYLWRFLPYHLHEAGASDEAASLTCDLRWVEAKTRRFGSVVAAIADLDLVDNPTTNVLRQVLAQAAPLLGPIDPPAALGATLASRLHGIPELTSVLEGYQTSLARPRLEPAWPLPDRPDPTRPPTAAGHTGGVISCAFSPDGTLLATTSDDGTAWLWNIPHGTVQAVLTGHTGGVWGCAFSPDGTLLATTSDDRTARVWNVPKGTVQAVLAGHTDWVWGCAFSPDGALLATTSKDSTARLWQITDGKTCRVLAGHTGTLRGCAFSPDGSLLATTGSDRPVRLWQIPDGTPTTSLTHHTGEVLNCAFSPDGTLLVTTCRDGSVRLWQIPECAEKKVLRGHTSGMWGCAFSPDGMLLATTSMDGTVRLWPLNDGIAPEILTGHENRMWDCAFSPDGALLATAGQNGTVQLWHLPDARKVAVLTGHTSRVTACEFSPDGTLLATTDFDHTARLWHVPNGTTAITIQHSNQIKDCAFSRDGTLLATTSDKSAVRIWSISDGALRVELTGHTDRVNGCAFSPDGTLLLTASSDATARLWQATDGTLTAALIGHTDIINNCTFSPDGSLLATASDDRTVRLWRIATGTEHAVLTHPGWVEGCAFSPDGSLLATASHDQTVRLWNVASRRCHCALRVASPLFRIAWHPDGTTLCTVGGAGTYLLYYQP